MIEQVIADALRKVFQVGWFHQNKRLILLQRMSDLHPSDLRLTRQFDFQEFSGAA
jgi:hypothetical protein